MVNSHVPWSNIMFTYSATTKTRKTIHDLPSDHPSIITYYLVTKSTTTHIESVTSHNESNCPHFTHHKLRSFSSRDAVLTYVCRTVIRASKKCIQEGTLLLHSYTLVYMMDCWYGFSMVELFWHVPDTLVTSPEPLLCGWRWLFYLYLRAVIGWLMEGCCWEYWILY